MNLLVEKDAPLRWKQTAQKVLLPLPSNPAKTYIKAVQVYYVFKVRRGDQPPSSRLGT
jgi:hypothetical protein